MSLREPVDDRQSAGGSDHMSQAACIGEPENWPLRELLEWILVRLLIIADRCEDPATRYELMQLVDKAEIDKW